MGTLLIKKQRGVSLSGFLGGVVIFIFVVTAAVKIVPAYLDDSTIKSKFNAVAHDPDMKNATEKDIRQAFMTRITVSNITSIKATDIDVTKDASGITLSANYSVKIPLIGNATLVLDFNPSSSAK